MKRVMIFFALILISVVAIGQFVIDKKDGIKLKPWTGTHPYALTIYAIGTTLYWNGQPVPIQIDPIQKPKITGNLNTCSNGSTVLDAGRYVSYQWSTAGTTETILVAPTSNHTYTVTVTDAVGVTGSASATVTVITRTATIDYTMPLGQFCTAPGEGFAIPTFSGTTGGIWSALTMGDYISINALTGAIDLARTQSSAIEIIKYTWPDLPGCPSNYVQCMISWIPAPVPDITGSLYITSGHTTTLTAQPGPYTYTYLWSTGGTDQSISSISTGTYTVTITDENYCSASKSVAVYVVP